MGIKPGFTAQDVEKLMQVRVARIDRAIVFSLQYLGEQCIRIAREQGDFTDRTGNLRNSEGYIIVRHGKIIGENFKRSAHVTTTDSKGNAKTTAGSKDGLQVGRAYAEELAKDHPKGYALIVVAGMSYAAIVEEKYHRDVLSSAQHYAEQRLPQLWAQLKRNIAKMK